MRALTIHQPWASLIVHGAPKADDPGTIIRKQVECRSWPYPPLAVVGKQLAIHASKTHERAAGKLIEMRFALNLDDLPLAQGAVIAVARVATISRMTCVADEFLALLPWMVEPGTWGFFLEDVRPLREPVACRGYQKFWSLPDDVLAKVTEQIGEI